MSNSSIRTYAILSGVTDLRGYLRDLKPQTQNRIIKNAVKTASAPIVKDAKARVTEDTGSLKKSLTSVVKMNNKTGSVTAYIGAKVGYFTATKKAKGGYTTKRSKSGDSKKSMVAPFKYSHLVEFGHRSVNGGGALPNYGEKVKGVWNSVNVNKSLRRGSLKATSFVAPRPFLAPAFKGGIDKANKALIAGFDKALEKEFERAKTKYSRKLRLG